jgi:hypothetical protein
LQLKDKESELILKDNKMRIVDVGALVEVKGDLRQLSLEILQRKNQ